MSAQPRIRNMARKIWHTMAIMLSVLVLLSSAAAVMGTWVALRSITDLSLAAFSLVEDTAIDLRQAGKRIDQSLAEMQTVATEIAQAAAQIGPNVADKGLIAALLTDEQEQMLLEGSRSVGETVTTIRDLLTTGIELYQTIDSLPFVTLPRPSHEEVAQIEHSIVDSQARAEELKRNTKAFRTGASAEIGKVEEDALRLNERLDASRTRLARLDADLANLQDLVVRLKTTIPRILTLLAFVLTIFLLYVIYSQVEVILIHVQRWRSLHPQSLGNPTRLENEQQQPN